MGTTVQHTCTPCCACDCVEGSLPYTVTLSFSGMTACDYGWDNNLDWLVVGSNSCFGSGLKLFAWPATNGGPLTNTSIFERGTGYAKIGRSEPALTASAPFGSGAELLVTLGQDIDGHLDYWGVATVDVIEAGAGYRDGDAVQIRCGASDSVGEQAVAVLRSATTEPELTASAPGGSGASLEIKLAPVAWGVSSISGTVSDVAYDTALTFSGASGVTAHTPASAVCRTTLSAPTTLTVNYEPAVLTESAYPHGQPYWQITGIDAAATGDVLGELSANLPWSFNDYTDGKFRGIVLDIEEPPIQKIIDYHICNPGHSWHDSRSATSFVVTRAGEYSVAASPTTEPTVTVEGHGGCTVTLTPVAWGVASVTINNGGSGYTNGATLQILPSAGDSTDVACVATIATDGSGAIAGISVTNAGRYKRRGGIDEVVVLSGGSFWRDDPAATPYVASVFLYAGRPGGGYGPWADRATLSAAVGDALDSDTWGSVTGVTIEDGGDSWTQISHIDLWAQQRTPLTDYTLVCRAINPRPLVRYAIESCFGSGAQAVSVGVVPGGTSFMSIPTTRVAPTKLVVRPPTGGHGATVTFTIAEGSDSGGPYWYVDSVTASGGDSYTADSAIAFDDVIDAENAPACTEFAVPPDVTVSVDAAGTITGATINNGGKFWRNKPWDGETPTGITTAPVVTHAGSGYAIYGRTYPAVTISAAQGSGASFTPTWTEDTDECGRPFFVLDSVAVSGGTGYADGAPLIFTVTSGTAPQLPAATLAVSGGVPTAVTVTRPGRGWREDSSLPPIVADVTVRIEQDAPSNGTGAEVVATVDTTPGESFGTISALTVTEPGDGYVLLGGPRPVSHEFAGLGDGRFASPNDTACLYAAMLYTLRCVDSFPSCGDPDVETNCIAVPGSGHWDYYQTTAVFVWFRGHGEKVFVQLTDPYIGWRSTTALTNCDSFSLEFEPYVNAPGSITLTRGGAFDACEGGHAMPCCPPTECSTPLSTLKISASASADIPGCNGGVDPCCPTATATADDLTNRPGGVMSRTVQIGIDANGNPKNATVGVIVSRGGDGVVRSYAYVNSTCNMNGGGAIGITATAIEHAESLPGCVPAAADGDETIGGVRLQWSVSFAETW